MLTPRQRRFVEEYVRDFNRGQAAIRAGYSPVSAQHNASALMRRPEVSEAVERATKEVERRLLFDGHHVIAELMCVAFSDIRSYLMALPDGKVRLKSLEELTPAETVAIEQYAPATKTRGPILRLRGKRQALRALARHVGLHEHRASGDPLPMLDERDRIRKKLFGSAERVAHYLPPPEED